MLDRLNPHFRLLGKAAAASEDDITCMTGRLGDAPPQFLELLREATEIEVQHASGIYLRFWGPRGCVEMDAAYGIHKRIPGAFPIGDDGGGRVLLFMEGRNGFGLYLVGYGDLDADDALHVVSTLGELLTDGTGIGVF